jgi:hypothetical protein
MTVEGLDVYIEDDSGGEKIGNGDALGVRDRARETSWRCDKRGKVGDEA